MNVEYFYFDLKIEKNEKLYACIERLVLRTEIQDKIMLELSMYKKAEGLFGIPLAKRLRKTRAPGKKTFTLLIIRENQLLVAYMR